MAQRLHITGASGSGTSSLGRALAARFGCSHFDTDDFYWWPTNPPFQIKREISERLDLLQAELRERDAFVLSGSLSGWGDPLIPLFTAVIYIEASTEVRVARLEVREARRYGRDAIAEGGPLHKRHRDFLDWAASYDQGPMGQRSRLRHRTWLAQLNCPVLILDGSPPLEELVNEVANRLPAA